MCQIAENQAWKSISNAAMEIGLYCRIWNFMLLYYYLESSCREGKTRLFLELHSKRIRKNVNKLHPKPPIPVDGKGKKYNHHEKLAKHLNRFPEVIWNLHPWRCSDFKRRRPWVAWRKLKVSPALNSFWMRHLQIFFHATWFCFFLQGTEVALCSLVAWVLIFLLPNRIVELWVICARKGIRIQAFSRCLILVLSAFLVIWEIS